MNKLSLYRILSEGGLGGHISHVYDDLNLTFGDLKDIIRVICSNKVNIEEEPRLKTDGQNMFVSYIDGEVRFARNKTHAKNYGQQSLTFDTIVQKWQSSPNVMAAFSQAHNILTTAFSKLSNEQLDEIFENGKRWLNIEVVYVGNANTITYNANYIVFHDIQDVNVEGETSNINMALRNKLFDYLEKAEATIINDFNIKNNVLKLKNFQLDESEYISLIDEINISGDDEVTIGEFLVDELFEMYADNTDVDNETLFLMLQRIVYQDTSLLPLKTLDSDARQLLKDLESKRNILINDATQPLSKMFGRLATDVLKNVIDFLANNPNDVIVDLKSKLEDAIKQIKQSNNEKWLSILDYNLRRISDYGGLDLLSPTEGLVFRYKNKYYKLTGLFAPLNTIIGTPKYDSR